VKSLYYCRSLSIQRADSISEKVENRTHSEAANNISASLSGVSATAKLNYEECLACQ